MKDVADQILHTLHTAGPTGLNIKELADRLGVDSKKVSSAVAALVKEGLVMEKTTENEKYIIRTGYDDDTESGSLSDMNGCPCYHCLKISRCGIRQPDSPVTCKELEEWMASAASS
ncbi:MAG: MarR family transcriptional regulator [Candidatus Thorarchaeota archaeon]|nr:MAG: hypothetical protein DRP09_12250 [Candidatus Thorarchaeota archaeon]RLI60194.1 MAG: hypothetical protein DRO87_00700 [Candidatus Thorarchaeota archaeon]